MIEASRVLANFLNHGILPFVGREKEKARLFDFWRATMDANGLRAALVSGEAGIGKSRLIEEVALDILKAGGAFIHTKLYQESATMLVPLLAKSVWHSVAGRELLKAEPSPDLESLNSALRRIGSLRPTIIIIEDIHHIQSGGSHELANLLEALSLETLSILATMRPGASIARGVLEPYVTDEIVLEGLSSDAFVQVCEQLFEGKVEPDVLQTLERATLGNALAVRSALRGALKTGFLYRREDAKNWRMSVPAEAFYRHLENNVRSLSEGMAAHLDESERVACESLAVLGELFATEAASKLVPNAMEMLERLRFKGMLTLSASAHAPLAGPASEFPLLAFSHSLLHKYFYDHTYIWGDEVVRLLTEDVPIYGIAPYLLLEKKEITEETPKERLLQLLKNMITLVSKLDSGSDWELGFSVHDVLTKVFERYRSQLTIDEDSQFEFDVLRARLTLLRRSIPNPQFKPKLDRLVELSSNIKSVQDAERRLAAAMCEYWYLRRTDNADTSIPRLREMIDSIACAYPDVVLTRPYRILLTYLAQYAAELSSQTDAAEVERRIKAMLGHPQCTDEIRNFVLGYIYPEFLNIFSTREELEKRLSLASTIENTSDYLKASFLTSKGELLLETADIPAAAQVIDRSITLFREHGFRYSLFSASIRKLSVEILLGKKTDGLIEDACSFITLLPNDPSITVGARRIIAQRLLPMCLLVGRYDIAEEIVNSVMPIEHPANAEHLLLLSLMAQKDAYPWLSKEPNDKRYLELFTAIREDSPKELLPAIQNILSGDVLRLNDVLGVALALVVARSCGLEKDHADDITQATVNILKWLDDRKLAIAATAFFERFQDLLPVKEARAWKQKLTKSKKRGAEALTVGASDKIQLSMIGSIEYVLPGNNTIERVRGSRLRSVLGVMTANAVLSEPLDHKEFCAIAAGEKEDFELARKTVNMAVAALRDDLGADAILTSGDTPMLNLDRVRIDFLEASDELHDALRHLRRGSIMKALADLNLAMTIVLGKVPFPTLYDNLFETLRDDFDARLRKTTLDLAKRLLSEDDLQSSITLLRHYFDANPDDKEVADLLRDALIRLGETTEAERIRIRSSGTLQVI